ncbi:MAG: ferredoxin-type protein NapG [Gammaproteobacteria bacterium]|nr:ferredoxin-type protein NapG [Gammaproteobacteria bacterium]
MTSPENKQAAKQTVGINRRRFISESARMVAGVSLLGLGLAQLARQSHASPAWAVRPPGAIAEQDFLGACVRCGLCVRDCPYDTLKLSSFGEAVANGSPYFIARDVPCEMCEDIPCVAACPTGALDKSLTDINNARMGLAILIDQENCLNFQGLRCDVCYRVCPRIDKAITLEILPNARTGKHALFIPTVHADACTGCGKCEKACVLEKAAIKVLPLSLARGELGHHYRWGWKNEVETPETFVPTPRLPDSATGGQQ